MQLRTPVWPFILSVFSLCQEHITLLQQFGLVPFFFFLNGKKLCVCLAGKW